jgi:hypothetical protein
LICFFKRFITPRIPIYGVIRVLPKIWAGFVDKAIREFGLLSRH